MMNSMKSIKATLQSLLERNLVDETFVEDVRDMMLLVNDDVDTKELFEGTMKSLDDLTIIA